VNGPQQPNYAIDFAFELNHGRRVRHGGSTQRGREVGHHLESIRDGVERAGTIARGHVDASVFAVRRGAPTACVSASIT
jgi:hypothetical protein